MTPDLAPDPTPDPAAVEIALRTYSFTSGKDAERTVAALTRAGWVHPPDRVAALEHLAETAQAYRAMPYDMTWSAFLSALDYLAALDAAPAETETPEALAARMTRRFAERQGDEVT